MTSAHTHYWLKHSGQQLTLLFACICASMSASAQEITVPILKQSKILQCARTEAKAKVALDGLWEIQRDEEGIPDELLLKGQKRVLHAASLDIVLDALLSTATKFPALRNQAERTMLQWNYCQTFRGGSFYDIEVDETGRQSFMVAGESPLGWSSFKRLGFFGDSESRFIPELISSDEQSSRQDFQHLFHRIYREQCFPHPDTSQLFESELLDTSSKITAEPAGKNEEYPHYWETDCVYPREAPELETKVEIVPVPVLVPELRSALELLPVPVLVPNIRSQVEILPVPVLVPGLRSGVEILPVPVGIPILDTQLDIVPVPVEVPLLEAQLDIVPVAIDVPLLEATLEIIPVPVEVPVLASQVEILPVPVDILLPKTLVEIEEQSVNIPVLASKVTFDPRPAPEKIFKRPAAPVVKNVGGNGGGYYAGGTGGVAPVVTNYAPVAPQVVRQPVRVAQPVQQVVQAQPVVQVAQPVIAARPSYVVDSNAPLLERLLGQIGNGNVLIIDKIQLTVNEYKGNVQTAISSSDVGTTQNVEAVGASVVKELVKSLPNYNVSLASTSTPAQAPQPTSKPAPVIAKVTPAVNVQKRPAPKKYVAKTVSVPYLQPMLVVGQPWQPAPKPVVISSSKKPQKKSVKVPSLASKAKVKPSAKKSVKKQAKKQHKAPAKKQTQSTPKSKSSSLFVYKPYDWKKKSEGQSVEELLQEYAEYEAKRKAALAAKKKIDKANEEGRTPVWVEIEESKPQPRVETHSKVETSKQQPVEISLTKGMAMPEEKVSFDFSGGRNDDDAKASDVIPLTLTDDAPLPYLIEEHFEPGSATKKTSKKATAKKKEKKPIGLAGNLYLKKSLGSGNMGIGGSINRKLVKDSYWFARVGWSYSLEQSDDPFSYSWGIGYSDWHAGTFSAQLNNWGPIKLGEGLALDKAVASFGYSVKSELLKKYRLSASGALNIPIKGNSSVAANFRWSPKENWYINASVSQPLEGGGEPKWSYGFGYSDWRPNKFNLQYSNYGPNELFDTNYNKNGTWSFSYNWKF